MSTFLIALVAVAATIGVFLLRTTGRPVVVTVERTRRVLLVLQAGGQFVAADLRRRVRMPRAEFYELMDNLKRRNLVCEVLCGPFLTGYTLTDDGVTLLRHDAR